MNNLVQVIFLEIPLQRHNIIENKQYMAVQPLGLTDKKNGSCVLTTRPSSRLTDLKPYCKVPPIIEQWSVFIHIYIRFAGRFNN
jgi:hypothetical protein